VSRVLLNLGSNIERENNLCFGLDALGEAFGELALSSVYESAAVGFSGDAFYNLAVALETRLGVGSLQAALRALEYERGRPANATRFSPRTLDIDILSYDALVGTIDGVELPRGEILVNAFVLRPLAELVPDLRHPVDGRCYAELWAAHDQGRQPLKRVDFCWRERRISRAD
jgi:2-amino-4-hydroxy-6-hydroxymethyldihydropteridine diphosphokinase